jgi:DNA-binding transcriptional MerR regulator
MKPADVAKTLDVSTNTVRNWTSWFALYLSDGAAPDGQKQRSFTPDDLRVLDAVAAWRLQGLQRNDIAQKLAAGAHLTDDFPRRLQTPEEQREEVAETAAAEAVQAQALVLREQLKLFLGPLRTDYERVIQERDRWQTEAFRLQEEVGLLKGRLEGLEHQPPNGSKPSRRRWWWPW